MEKMWAGRFNKALDKQADDFNSSIHFDSRMYKQDITGSIAHAEMLGKQGIIPKADAELIVKTLGEILEDIEAGKVEFLIDAAAYFVYVESLIAVEDGLKLFERCQSFVLCFIVSADSGFHSVQLTFHLSPVGTHHSCE